MDDDNQFFTVIAVLSIIAGILVGVVGLVDSNTPSEAEASATLSLDAGSGNSTEIRGVFVVKTSNVSGNESDNLFNDPSGIVEASIISDGGSAEIDWGTEYTLVVASWGEDNETSLDAGNIRLGIDGDYWGDGDGSVQMPGENISYEYEYATGFSVDGDQHHALNYWAKDQTFTPSRDESISVNEILLQAYF